MRIGFALLLAAALACATPVAPGTGPFTRREGGSADLFTLRQYQIETFFVVVPNVVHPAFTWIRAPGHLPYLGSYSTVAP